MSSVMMHRQCTERSKQMDIEKHISYSASLDMSEMNKINKLLHENEKVKVIEFINILINTAYNQGVADAENMMGLINVLKEDQGSQVV